MVAKRISGETITRIFTPPEARMVLVRSFSDGVPLLGEVVAERLGAGGVAQLGHRLVLEGPQRRRDGRG